MHMMSIEMVICEMGIVELDHIQRGQNPKILPRFMHHIMCDCELCGV